MEKKTELNFTFVKTSGELIGEKKDISELE